MERTTGGFESVLKSTRLGQGVGVERPREPRTLHRNCPLRSFRAVRIDRGAQVIRGNLPFAAFDGERPELHPRRAMEGNVIHYGKEQGNGALGVLGRQQRERPFHPVPDFGLGPAWRRDGNANSHTGAQGPRAECGDREPSNHGSPSLIGGRPRRRSQVRRAAMAPGLSVNPSGQRTSISTGGAPESPRDPSPKCRVRSLSEA